MRWLVTGGCGFVGRTLIRRLREEGADIRIVDDLSAGTREDLEAAAGSGLEVIVGDVRDADLVTKAATSVDAFVHLAANAGVARSVEDPRFDFSVNALGTLNCLESCRKNGVSRFVFASSSAPIGDCEPPIHEEIAPHPLSPYGASKLVGEAYCSAYKWSFGVDTVALRFGNCYGPYSSHKQSVVAKFIREALAGAEWEIYGDGTQTRDFIYVEDIVDAILRGAVARDVGGQTFQVATNRETSLNELVDCLAGALAKHGVTAPKWRTVDPRVADIRRNYSDVRKAARLLGWQAKTSLAEGLDKTVAWFLSPKLQRR